ncbi:hypothetical protein [Algoriphagus litoralis]|uniref:hypothetical protein n=1 Tax=Algoriphagus litoralis TaxID=2202829 RepID=UPI000DBA1D11|nr:hypothetical protein [Algoriphagus litoralis]
MVIQTSKCEFLIVDNERSDGCVFIYSDSLEELQRFFGSSVVEFSSNRDWKYKILTCKQEFANALILMVKEINYTDFFQDRLA